MKCCNERSTNEPTDEQDLATSGMVFDVQRFSLHDGPGIRTTVFFKGCPLRCVWCHNPESQAPVPEMEYREERCTQCGKCARVCSIEPIKGEGFQRTLCRDEPLLRMAAEACPNEALKVVGHDATVEQLLEEIMRDTAYYRESGGGLTLSGGEPLYQCEFAQALLRAAKRRGLHTCVETCGAVSTCSLLEAAPYTDLFFFDYKVTDPKRHRRLTGVDNQLIMANLGHLAEVGSNIVIRCPIVPGVNDSEYHLQAIKQLLHRFPQVLGLEMLPYHDTGRGKYQRLGRKDPLELNFPLDK